MICQGAAGARAGERRGVGPARIKRLDAKTVIGLADELLFERRAFERLVDQSEPLLAGGGRKFGAEREIVGLGVSHGRKMPRLERATQAFGRLSSSAGVRSPPFRRAARHRRCAFRRSPVRHDLGQRHQHEGALEQARVRQDQIGLVQDQVAIGDEVDIERARPPTLLVVAVAPEDRARPPARAQAARAAAAPVATAMAALMKGGWSVTPQGGVL